MNRKKQLLTLFVGVIFFTTLLLTSVFAAAHVHHNCEGPSCAVCADIRSHESLKNFSDGEDVSFLGEDGLFYDGEVLKWKESLSFDSSLVSLKVKLTI